MSDKILVIGLGMIGAANAKYISSLGLLVDGYDISHDASQRALDTGIINNIATDFIDYDYYLICVSTHDSSDMRKPSMQNIYDVIGKLAREGKPKALVGIDSTIEFGMTSKVTELLHHRFHVVYVPERFYDKEQDIHGVNQLRVIGGCKECCLAKGIHFYQNLLRIPLHITKTPLEAEFCKIYENSDRYIQIALAQFRKMLCNRIGIEYEASESTIATKWNMKHMLKADKGI